MSRKILLIAAACLLVSFPSFGGEPTKTQVLKFETDFRLPMPQPMADEDQCEEVIVGEGHDAQTLISCFSKGPLLQAKTACKDVLSIAGNAQGFLNCRANCAADCKFTAAQLAAVDARLDTTCAKTCAAQGACPAGQQCTRDAVINKVTVPTCIPAAKFCAKPAPNPTPDFCIELRRVGECTCKCV